MITIVDYGAGNLRSVQNTMEALGLQFETTNSPQAVRRAVKIVLPGVGHFGQMVRELERLGLREAILSQIQGGVPFLGICVGLQCLFEASEEAPQMAGLGVFQGTVKRFQGAARVPHMGWNSLTCVRPSRLLAGLDENVYTYFAHSFYAPVNNATAATCDYIQPYSAVIEHKNVHAVQFHPEKSSAAGLKVMENFAQV